MRITSDDKTDITEAVQILYDTTVHSMDWGSGFLDEQEMMAIINLAIHMGWELPDLGRSMPSLCVAANYPKHYKIVTRGDYHKYETTVRI